VFAVSLILPIVALCLVVYFFWYPLPLLLGAVEYSQELDSAPVRVKELAYAREQDDEYETLLALGFRPLGTQNELYGFLSTKSPTLVFAHDQLPIFAYLIVNLDQQLFLKMITSGTGDCILTTCSCANGAVVNEPTYRSNIHAVSKTEELFALHVKAIEEWESEGFEPHGLVVLSGNLE